MAELLELMILSWVYVLRVGNRTLREKAYRTLFLRLYMMGRP
jgi:hypothetical protein